MFNNKVRMLGPDIRININDKFVMNAQYVYRTDSHVFDEDSGLNYDNVLTHGGFAELIFSPKGDRSKWYLTGLCNWVDSDVDALDYTSATLHAGFLARRNLRFVSEFTYEFSGIQNKKLSLGFVAAF
jgi:hypothetical protein